MIVNKNYIQVRNIKLSYSNIVVIDNFSFSIEEGEVIAILGPSGCGKTSFLNILSGILPPSAGNIYINNINVKEKQNCCSYMFQDDLMVPWRTVYDNVLLPLEIDRIRNKIDIKYVDELLSEFGLSNCLKLFPYQLSGGMRRRAAFVRTLCINRDVYLFDEPTSGLDYLLRLQLEEKLLGFLIENKKTAIIITHDIESAVAIADRIFVFSKKPSYLANIYNVGIGKKYGSTIKARETKEYTEIFKEILKTYIYEDKKL